MWSREQTLRVLARMEARAGGVAARATGKGKGAAIREAMRAQRLVTALRYDPAFVALLEAETRAVLECDAAREEARLAGDAARARMSAHPATPSELEVT